MSIFLRIPSLHPISIIPFLLLLLLHYCPPFLLAILTQTCSDGAPAVFPCNGTKVEGKRVFVCALDLQLGCELIQGQFYCCAQTEETSTLSRMEMLLVDRMMREEESQNSTISAETRSKEEEEETLEIMNDTGGGGNSSSNSTTTTTMAAENMDGPPMVGSSGGENLVEGMAEMGGNGNGTIGRETAGTMVDVEKAIGVVDNSAEGGGNGTTNGRDGGDSGMSSSSSSGAVMLTTTSPTGMIKNGNGTTTKRPLCIDIGPQCLLTSKLCLNPQYSRLVRLQCPRTCNLCTSDGRRMEEEVNPLGKCADRGKDCGRAEFLCRTPAFSALMVAECAKTCGHCDGDGSKEEGAHMNGVKTSKKRGGEKMGKSERKEKAGEKCADAYQRCYVWRLQGFCMSTNYSEFLKRRYCARTCNLCAEAGRDGGKEGGN